MRPVTPNAGISATPAAVMFAPTDRSTSTLRMRRSDASSSSRAACERLASASQDAERATAWSKAAFMSLGSSRVSPRAPSCSRAESSDAHASWSEPSMPQVSPSVAASSQRRARARSSGAPISALR